MRYFKNLFQEFSDGNFLNAKTCANKLIERLRKECVEPHYQHVDHIFRSAIVALMDADKLCDQVLNLEEEQERQGLDEKAYLQKKRQEINMKISELQNEKTPYLNLSLAISFLLMSVIFVFIPNFFGNSVLMYHLCGFIFFIGFILLKQDIDFRRNVGFVSNSKNSTNKRSLILLIQSMVYIIPLFILSLFFFDKMIIKVLLFVQIWFCSILFLDGLFILINNSIKNKKLEKKSIWNIISGAMTVIGFVIQILQLFKIF